MNPAVRVAVGILFDDSQRVLVARRPEDSHQGGLWEFPGGKQHSNETRYEALCRELDEELGIQVRRANPLIRVAHDYGDRKVELDVWRVEEYTGTASGREGQPVRWVSHEELGRLAMPAADRPIIQAVRLPAIYAISPEPGADIEPFLERAGVLFSGGVRLLQLRARQLDQRRFDELASALINLAREHESHLVLNTDVATALRLGADGIHLSAQAARTIHAGPVGERRKLKSLLTGVSCHNLEELKLAEQLEADFAVLSPVCTTQSHPEAQPLGWESFEQLVSQVNLPVYALGGLVVSDLERAVGSGAQGVAAIRGIWSEAE